MFGFIACLSDYKCDINFFPGFAMSLISPSAKDLITLY